MKRTALTLAFATLVASLSPTGAIAQSSVDTTAHYIGAGSDWFDAANWSTGRVPAAHDDVVLDAGDVVIIDPVRAPQPLHIRDLIVQRGASLETLPGTVLKLRDEVIDADAQVAYRGSATIGETLLASATAPGAGAPCASAPCGGALPITTIWEGLTLNPTPKQKRIIVLQSSVVLEMGLGGTSAASLRQGRDGRVEIAAGPGHYATLSADTITLGGDLWLNLHYGFQPLPGERFTVVRGSRSVSGAFAGLSEGSLAACTDDGVGLFVSYRGGDGNDVALSADAVEMEACRQPTVQRLQAWTGPTPDDMATREHVLLARQVGVPR